MRVFVEVADVNVCSFACQNILERRPPVALPALARPSIAGPNPALEIVSARSHTSECLEGSDV